LISFGQIGAALSSFPAGLVFDWLGPTPPLAMSGFFMFLGYLLLYLLLNRMIAFNYFGTIMSYFVVGIGCQLTTIVILSSNLVFSKKQEFKLFCFFCYFYFIVKEKF
jgi:hypothetical protein